MGVTSQNTLIRCFGQDFFEFICIKREDSNGFEKFINKILNYRSILRNYHPTSYRELYQNDSTHLRESTGFFKETLNRRTELFDRKSEMPLESVFNLQKYTSHQLKLFQNNEEFINIAPLDIDYIIRGIKKEELNLPSIAVQGQDKRYTWIGDDDGYVDYYNYVDYQNIKRICAFLDKRLLHLKEIFFFELLTYKPGDRYLNSYFDRDKDTYHYGVEDKLDLLLLKDIPETAVWSMTSEEWRDLFWMRNRAEELYREMCSLKDFYNGCLKQEESWVLVSHSVR